MQLSYAVGVSAQAAEPRFTRVFQVGAVDGAPEYTFGLIADMAFGRHGNVYVLDAGNAVVREYDQAGRHVRSFGRGGEGPGEMRYPTKLLVSTNRITVFDGGLQRAVVFDHDGKHIETRGLTDGGPLFDVKVPLRYGKWLGVTTGVRIGTRQSRLGRESSSYIQREGPAVRDATANVVAVLDPARATVDTLSRIDHGFPLYLVPEGAGMVPRYWGPGGGWALSGDSSIALVDGFRGTVRILNVMPEGAVETRTEQVPITPIPLTENDWREAAVAAFRERGREFAGEVIGPPYRAQLGAALFGADGTLWIPRIASDPLKDSAPAVAMYFVVPPGGEATSSVRLPNGFTLMAVLGDLLLAHRRNDLGVDMVELWRIHR